MNKSENLPRVLEFIHSLIASVKTGGMWSKSAAYSHYQSRLHRDRKIEYINGYMEACSQLGIIDAELFDELFHKTRDAVRVESLTEEARYAAAVYEVLNRIDLQAMAEDVLREWDSKK